LATINSGQTRLFARAAGQTFLIQETMNLNSPLWQTIATNQFGIDGKFQFLDTSASNYPIRFYRSATP
jgi:hypothetical protein